MTISKSARHIILFTLVAVLSGWIGYAVDKQLDPQPEGESIGMALWLILPLLAAILLWSITKGGWRAIGMRPRFAGNLRWYAASVIIFPAITVVISVLGKLLGWIDLSGFNNTLYFSTLTSTLLPNFIKNIFEEFVWRGYLTTQLIKFHLKDGWLYLIVGSVWGAWHLPYYLFFLPESAIAQVLPVDRLTFASLAILTMISWVVMYVELYRITKSIWPVVLLHTIEDATVNHLILDQHMVIASGKEIWLSPIVGVISSVLYLIVGLLLRHYRIRKTQ